MPIAAPEQEPEHPPADPVADARATPEDADVPEATPHRPGETLAEKYRLERLLGEGGMGSVWRARSLLLDVDVAVKLVPRGTASPETCDRLLREARAAAGLVHPSIVRVFDFGTTPAGEPYLVMEHLEGTSLRALLEERGRTPATTAVRLILPVISALAAAHARGVVHRDIKPENVVIVPGEGDLVVPKLVDFGIAKISTGQPSTITQKGALLGSPSYMSPEQARGLDAVDAASDLWSACVVLYELITGRRPFDGPNHGAVLYAIYADQPTPTTVHAAGDAELWEIIRRGLEKRPEDRWPTAKALGRELAEWATARGVATDAAGASIAEAWLGRTSFVDLGPIMGARPATRSSADLATETSPHSSPLPPPPPIPILHEPATTGAPPPQSLRTTERPSAPDTPSDPGMPVDWPSIRTVSPQPRRRAPGIALATMLVAAVAIISIAAYRRELPPKLQAAAPSPSPSATATAPLPTAATTGAPPSASASNAVSAVPPAPTVAPNASASPTSPPARAARRSDLPARPSPPPAPQAPATAAPSAASPLPPPDF